MTEGIQVTPEALRAKYSEIADLDVVLDAQSGSKAAGKRAQKNALASEANTQIVENAVSTVASINDENIRVGTYFALVNALDEQFSKRADEIVEELVNSAQAENTEKLSDAEIAEISERRKNLVKEFKALQNILEMFGQDVSDVPEPKTRRGSRGPRGPRTLSKFQYRVNETDLEEDVNSLATVAKLAGLDGGVKELKSIITESGVDLKNPPAEWDAEINEAVHLYATALPQYEDDFNGDDDDESDDDE